MKNLFGFPLYAVCCILSICMPVNLVSSGVGLKGNWPTVQCTIQQYRLEKNGQLRMQYGPVFFQCPLVNVTRNVSFSLLPSRAVCLTLMHTGGNLLAILGTKSAYTCLLAPHPQRKKKHKVFFSHYFVTFHYAVKYDRMTWIVEMGKISYCDISLLR